MAKKGRRGAGGGRKRRSGHRQSKLIKKIRKVAKAELFRNLETFYLESD